jgi:selenium-binding protein 1
MIRLAWNRGGWVLGLSLLVGSLDLGIAPGRASAETCLSPFVKRLDRPEKYLYVFCVDADAKDNDFFAVIDVNPDSGTYGTILHTVDIGT